MKLKTQQVPPRFNVKDLYGKSIKLDEFKGKKVLLSFFRYASCPFCNLRVHQLIKNYEQLADNGLVILAIFHSSEADMKHYVGQQKPPFAIIPDPQGILYATYGIEDSFLGKLKSFFRVQDFLPILKNGFLSFKTIADPSIIPADFLINQNLVIDRAYYGNDLGDHIPLDEIKNWLKLP